MVDPPLTPRRLATEPAAKVEADAPASSSSAAGESVRGARSAPCRPSKAMIRQLPNPRPLHNFVLPRLRWGNRKSMLCVKDFDHSESSSSSSSVHRRSANLLLDRTRFGAGKEGGGIDVIRGKLMLNPRTKTDGIKEELLKGDDEEGEMEVERTTQKMTRAAAMAGLREEYEAAESRPWNLRTRRAGSNVAAARNGSPARKEGVVVEERATTEKHKEREKFAVALRRNEIEDDFWMLTGNRPPRRPKKRPRAIQRTMDMLFPGLWLTEITSDRYKVVEVPDNKAKRDRSGHPSMKVSP
ncbi:hypothetical protein MLD38_003908 [Melastoma candidum]|uniref:Uncharacterized protein n=1 Tax=Melastoma candidum TaxID=119954 RepID=A0ACB9S396_9MYRT|nr:hypothetical protein MLD38_003908 [Melastoma candidum]